jgi:hypothetical protein
MAKRSSTKSSSETGKVKAVNLAYYKALSARDLRDGRSMDLRCRQHPDSAAGQSAFARRMDRDQAELGSLLAKIRPIQRVNASDQGEHERAGRMGAWYRDVASAQKDGRSKQ